MVLGGGKFLMSEVTLYVSLPATVAAVQSHRLQITRDRSNRVDSARDVSHTMC